MQVAVAEAASAAAAAAAAAPDAPAAAAAAGGAEDLAAEPNAMTVAALQEALAARGLDTKWTPLRGKKELVDRLQARLGLGSGWEVVDRLQARPAPASPPCVRLAGAPAPARP